jgi:hypothetical protein
MKMVRACVRDLALGIALCLPLACTSTRAATYDSPRAAMLRFAEVAGTDAQSIDACLGPGAHEMLESGDAAADREDALEIQRAIQQGVTFEDLDSDRKVALLGDQHWPFPIALVHEDAGWRFDLAAAREELLDRHIGSNELMTIATLHQYVDAQREYRAEERDGNSPAYARRLISCDGKRDGLYWPTADDEPQSPFGPMVAQAACEEEKADGGQRLPFHGYYFKTLCAQGKHASGGAKNYVDDKGLMTGGCALLAWPAHYGSTGVMTFEVSQVGIVFQKDLGADTEKLAPAIQSYDPDDTWDPAAE